MAHGPSGSWVESMAAGKIADAYGLLPGNSLEVSDGESAYTQTLLGGTKNWIRLPRDQWPKEWRDAGPCLPSHPS